MQPRELSFQNSRVVDDSLKALQDIVEQEKSSLRRRIDPLLAKMELDNDGFCKSTQHNHNILGQCVGMSRVSALKVAKLVSGEYASGVKKIEYNIERYTSWLKA